MEFLSYENLFFSYKKARKSRKNKQEVYFFDLKMEENLIKIFHDLKNKNYTHASYTKIVLYDSKKRFIHSPNFRDHILHHMLYNSLYNKIDRKFIFSTFACRKWFGSHKAILYVKKRLKSIKKSWKKLYYLKLDISKYFFSINHDILKNSLFSIIEDKNLRYAIEVFLKSYTTSSQFDSLFDENSHYRKQKQKGIPIGSIISQLFANFYLNEFDHFIKRKLKIKNYFRYMDDLLFIWEKEELKKKLKFIIDYLRNNLYLEINPKKISFNLVDDGIKFVGYKIKNERIYVGKRIIKWLQRFIKKLKWTWEKDYYILQRLENVWQSRRWFFDISDFWQAYIKNIEVEKIL